MDKDKDPHWGNHILAVFGVLAGLSFAQTFKVLANANFELSQVMLCFLVFYIVLDTWYFLHKELTTIDIDTPLEVILYILCLIAYAGIPYLYGIESNISINFGPPEWMLVDLALVCIISALRTTVTVINYRKPGHPKPNDAQKKVIGTYSYYSITNPIYGILFIVAIAYSMVSHISSLTKAIIIVCIWISIRIVDVVVIPRTYEVLADIVVRSKSK